jgi:hypothetical protein
MDSNEQDEKSGLNQSRSGFGPVAGFCERSYEPSDSIKGGEFLDQLSSYQLLKKESAL